MRRGPPTAAPLVGFALTLVLAALAASCTEDPLALEPEAAPGATSVTRDVMLPVTALVRWRDTSVIGFALPSEAAFTLLSNDGELAARTLGRFDVPDTIATFADTLPVERFEEVSLRIQIDTVRSSFSDFPVTFRLFALTRPFDADSASWTESGAAGTWTTPGGDLGPVLATGELAAIGDTVPLALSVSGDSLLKAWQELDEDAGVALVVEGPPARARITQFILRYDALLVGRTTPVAETRALDPRTFIVDPPLPPIDLGLRVGGLPASRAYLDFDAPETVGGIPLRGATINHAELILTPLPPPPSPFALERSLSSRQISLLGDPFVFGAKTPIGAENAVGRSLDPDSLAAGRPFRLDVTLLVARAAGDSAGPIRIGLRGDPDAQTLAYWEFGSIEAEEPFRPRLRIVLTPPPEFDVP